MKKIPQKKSAAKKAYHQEIIVKPAKRLLQALQDAKKAYPGLETKSRKTATSR